MENTKDNKTCTISTKIYIFFDMQIKLDIDIIRRTEFEATNYNTLILPILLYDAWML